MALTSSRIPGLALIPLALLLLNSLQSTEAQCCGGGCCCSPCCNPPLLIKLPRTCPCCCCCRPCCCCCCRPCCCCGGGGGRKRRKRFIGTESVETATQPSFPRIKFPAARLIQNDCTGCGSCMASLPGGQVMERRFKREAALPCPHTNNAHNRVSYRRKNQKKASKLGRKAGVRRHRGLPNN